MKHEELLVDKDRIDLAKAAEMVRKGKYLRAQVLGRLRVRAKRAREA